MLHLGRRRNPGGVHAAQRAIRVFLNWYENEYEPQGRRNPIRKAARTSVPQHQLAPSALCDPNSLLATCERRTLVGDRDRAMLSALLDSGRRPSEFLVKWALGVRTRAVGGIVPLGLARALVGYSVSGALGSLLGALTLRAVRRAGFFAHLAEKR